MCVLTETDRMRMRWRSELYAVVVYYKFKTKRMHPGFLQMTTEDLRGR